MTSTDPGPKPPAGQRPTRQRLQIRAAVGDLPSFATAQEIHDRLRRQGSAVGLATVYRTLQAMAAAGELDALRAPDGQVVYRTCSPGHHHHLICRTCGRTVELDLPGLETLIGPIAADHGFSEIEHELEFFGLCSTCAQR